MNLEVSDILKIIDHMTHSVGLDVNKIRKGQRKHECYRNCFYGESLPLNQAAEMGLVTKIFKKGVKAPFYYVSQKGFEFLSKIFCLEISDDTPVRSKKESR